MAGWFSKAYWNAFTLWHARDEGELPYRPPDEILALQNRRVRSIVAHAYETVPYYREVIDQAGLSLKDFQTADDLAKLPILTPNQLAREPERFLSHRYANGRSLQLHSSGTSGRLRKIHYDPGALFMALAHGHRQRLVLAHFVGRTLSYREMVSNRPGSIAFRIRDFYESYSWVPGNINLERRVLSPGDAFEDNVEKINAFQPDVLRGYGSYIGALFRRARELGLHIFRPRAVVYGGDRMADADRSLVEAEFGVPVLSTYQAAEALRIAFQCERQEGFHVSLDHTAVRVIDASGNPVSPGGSGEIVISNLTNRATVLLNYKLDDVVTLGREPCPCGRTLPTIERIDGRADDLIALPGGRLIHSLVVLAALHRVPGVIQVQLIQEALRRFLLRAVGIGALDREQAYRGLEAAMGATLGNDISVAIEWVDAIPPEAGGKVRAAISRCRNSELEERRPR
jgi:phenylacetate-CoA ligase